MKEQHMEVAKHEGALNHKGTQEQQSTREHRSIKAQVNKKALKTTKIAKHEGTHEQQSLEKEGLEERTCNLAPFCKKVGSVFMKLPPKEPLRRLVPPKLKSN